MKSFLNKILVGSAVFSFSITAALACTEDGQHGIAPDNKLNIPVNSLRSNISEAVFKENNAKAIAFYSSVFKAQGREFQIISKWEDGTVNAFAKRNGNVSEVHMFGGLARHPKMTPDGFMLVICHEIGHHLGGAVKNKSLFGIGNWASNEGQSDYFATLKCSREIWKNEDNAAIVAKIEVPMVVTQSCQKSFDKSEEIALCQRAVMAGKALGDTLADMGQLPATDIEKKDPAVVKRTDNAHPKAQCRLDTYFAAAVCSKSKDEALDDKDPTIGTCSEEKGDVVGIRPLCWYKPLNKDGTESGSSWPSF